MTRNKINTTKTTNKANHKTTNKTGHKATGHKAARPQNKAAKKPRRQGELSEPEGQKKYHNKNYKNNKPQSRYKHGPERSQRHDRQPAVYIEGAFMPSRGSYGFVRTKNRAWPDIFIPGAALGEARPYDLVRVRLKNCPETEKINKESRLEGAVTAVLYHVDAAELAREQGADTELVLRQFGLEPDFPPEVLREAANTSQEVSRSELAQEPNRRDRRDLPFVTIDGVDSRDFDDAVYCRRMENGNYFLSVQIADVAHYVPMGSALEQEAFRRATSVYLPDRVLPMLPFELSNGICSLNAGVDRLTLACDMEWTPRGRLVWHDIYPGVIRVAQRLDYDTVNAALLERDRQAERRIAAYLPMLRELAELQGILERMRSRRGALNFDFPELKVKLDENGHVIGVGRRRSRLAEKMIEQAMLAANETVAEHFYRQRQPFVYRVHEGPVGEKLAALNVTLGAFEYGLLSDEASPKEVQRLLRAAAGRPEEDFMQLMVLRSMNHAEYSAKLAGHFGLAAKFYCHFTSPIRRYPDLAVHRLIKRALGCPDDTLSGRKLDVYTEAAAKQASLQERVAEEAEREAVKLKCCLFMQDKIGQRFAARVTGMTASGIFVAIDERFASGIEGRVALEDLPPDEYKYIPEVMLMHGHRRNFTLGDPIEVSLVKVDLLERRLDFAAV